MHNSQPTFSIIIPVHAVTQCELERCLRSISEQVYTDYECLLIVDDDSPIPNGRTNTTVIRVSPCSAGTARNIGIEASRGKWLLFADCDDSLDRDYLALAYKFAHEVPNAIVSFEGAHSSRLRNTEEPHSLKLMPAESVRPFFLNTLCFVPNCRSEISTVVWNKIYPRESLLSLRFPAERMLSEDVAFVIRLGLSGVSFVSAQGSIPYKYNDNPNSVTNTLSPKNIGLDHLLSDYLSIANECLHKQERLFFYSHVSNIAIAYCMEIYLTFLRKGGRKPAPRKIASPNTCAGLPYRLLNRAKDSLSTFRKRENFCYFYY